MLKGDTSVGDCARFVLDFRGDSGGDSGQSLLYVDLGLDGAGLSKTLSTPHVPLLSDLSLLSFILAPLGLCSGLEENESR